jgi:MoaA/NifB/PqqE/SkfB family radical SAM enzyme
MSEKSHSFARPQANLLLGSFLETLKVRYERNLRPRFLSLAVTYDCNMRCKMCNIWKMKSTGELTSAEIVTALKSDRAFLSKLRWVQITGGEPSLKRDGIQSILRTFLEICPNLISIGFPTNGYLSGEIIKLTKEALDDIHSLKRKTTLQVYVSLDGTREIHDLQRGVTGSFDASLATIGLLKELERESRLLRVALECTVTPMNISKLTEILGIAQRLDCEIYFTPATISNIFYRNRDLAENINLQNSTYRLACFYKSVLRLEHFDPLMRYYMNYFYEDAINIMKGNTRRIPCTAGHAWLFVNPCGLVYPCHIVDKDFGLGNIGELSTLNFSKNTRVAMKKLKASGKCEYCMENCGLACNVQLNVNAFLAYLIKGHLFDFLADSVKYIST